MVKVSLIVLANGDEKNLGWCIDSLEKQDYEDKELICASITEVEWLKEHENINMEQHQRLVLFQCGNHPFLILVDVDM